MKFFKQIFNIIKNRKIALIGFIVLLAVFFLFYQQRQLRQEMRLKVQFIEEKNILRDELDDLIDEHDELLDEYGNLNDQLEEKDSIIQNQITEIRGLIRTKNNLEEARKKIEILKQISKRYLQDIDSLFTVNKLLTLEKDSVIKINKKINWKNYKLNKENKELEAKVNQGSILEVYDISVDAFRYRSTGTEISTRSAKKTQVLRSCFKISANQIASTGERDIYIQYVNELGEILFNSEMDKILIGDKEISYTSKQIINYQNQELELCVDWEREGILLAGIYQLNIIIDNRISGRTAFRLK